MSIVVVVVVVAGGGGGVEDWCEDCSSPQSWASSHHELRDHLCVPVWVSLANASSSSQPHSCAYGQVFGLWLARSEEIYPQSSPKSQLLYSLLTRAGVCSFGFIKHGLCGIFGV